MKGAVNTDLAFLGFFGFVLAWIWKRKRLARGARISNDQLSATVNTRCQLPSLNGRGIRVAL